MLLLQLGDELDDPALLSHLLDHVEQVEELLDADADAVVLQLGHHRRDVVWTEHVGLLQDGLQRRRDNIEIFTVGNHEKKISL